MQFLENFQPELVISSPGRINLIGEHTDYNMGYVLPTAIEKNITFSFRKNGSENQCHVYSKTYDTGFEIDLNKIAVSKVEWENYILGVLNEISKRTDKVRGFDCVVESNLPTGSGLSSSAALECGLAFGLNEIFDLGLSKIEMVQLSQTAEHTYVGTQCGIMDQFASVMSEAGNVILLDCRSLDYDHIPIDLNPYKIILLNTKVSHNLASSEYNTRKQECEQGVAIIQKKHPNVKSLRDVDSEMLLASKEEMDPIVYNRCSFIVKENDRVLEMVKALKENNLKEVGQILYKAHEGISTEYEVSCPESDFLVDFSKGNDQVLGARQTGGGFGGCTLNIVHDSAVEDFVSAATKAYKDKFNITLEAFEVRPSGGTSAI
ncbi:MULTISPECIES: galactokinase [Zobellia]|uniref:galactokinase n=1 Tax=Zobellia TaxID=112040 RepID=UPI001BFF7DE2|nr:MULTISPECIES: galactokinase [Zobellia]MBT9188351.1 galactokinase [Zobellia russellii]MBU2976442.1 galactokinase [Zobellia sp. B3R18]